VFTFNWTIDAGQVINAVGILVGGVWIAATINNDLKAIKERVKATEDEVRRPSEVVISNARLDVRVISLSERLANMEKRVFERND
jgi:hypothetical protein